MSDSATKLRRLALPDNMQGMSVLDLGCNEGYFCHIAAERGARSVIGIDYVRDNIKFAQSRYKRDGIQFIYDSWHNFPAGSYDLIIWSSAMHYDPDHKSVMRRVAANMAPGALFVLECGVIDGSGAEMRLIKRHSDTLFYPTKSQLSSDLSTYFDWRQISQGEIAEGDPIPRYVYHAYTPQPQVCVITSPASSRASSLIALFERDQTKDLCLRRFIEQLISPPYIHGELQALIASVWSGSLSKVIDVLRKEGKLIDFLRLFLEPIQKTDRLVRITLDCNEITLDDLSIVLKGRAGIWDISRYAR